MQPLLPPGSMPGLIYMYQFCFLYMLKFPIIYSLSERERDSKSVNMQRIVLFTLSSLKIVPTIKTSIMTPNSKACCIIE